VPSTLERHERLLNFIKHDMIAGEAGNMLRKRVRLRSDIPDVMLSCQFADGKRSCVSML